MQPVSFWNPGCVHTPDFNVGLMFKPEQAPQLYMEGSEIGRMLDELAARIRVRMDSLAIQDPLLVGIETGGDWVARRLQPMLGYEIGQLNISFYRDDFSRIGLHPRVGPSRLPDHVDDRHVILVDDVILTGRTVRAALNEIFDYGRPAGVSLIVLIDRPGRELPVQPDVYGRRLELQHNQQLKLVGPEPLQLFLQALS